MPIPAPDGGWPRAYCSSLDGLACPCLKMTAQGHGLPFCSSGTKCVFAHLEFRLLVRKDGNDSDLCGPGIMPVVTATLRGGLALRTNETEDQSRG